MSKIFDSNIYVAAFLADDSQHQAAKKIVEKTKEDILIPYVVFSEVLTVLTYKHSKDLAEAFLDYVLQDQRFTIIDNASLEEFAFWRSQKAQLSFADFSLIFLAKKYNARLMTFDKELEKLASKIGTN